MGTSFLQTIQLLPWSSILPSPLDLVIYGVGYHHAGLDMADRKTVEAVFINGELPVLCELALHTVQLWATAALCSLSDTQHVMVHLLSGATICCVLLSTLDLLG